MFTREEVSAVVYFIFSFVHQFRKKDIEDKDTDRQGFIYDEDTEGYGFGAKGMSCNYFY